MRAGPYGAEYILASSREIRLARTKPEITKALKSKKYGVVARRKDIALLKRAHDPSGNDALLADWKLK